VFFTLLIRRRKSKTFAMMLSVTGLLAASF